MSIEALSYYLGLGFFHGLNPAMGWLFAVALALQHNSLRWIGRAVIALGVGHFLSIFCLCAVFILLGRTLPQVWVKGLCVSALFGFGGYWLFRARHPRWVGMNVGLAELVGWSFLMASAHGAGLMLVAGSSLCGKSFLPLPVQWDSLKLFFYPSVIHSIGYFFTVSILATLVFRADLLGLLYRKWINFDILWAISLFLAGIGTILA